MAIIGIIGRISHGKDTTADIIRLLLLGYPRKVVVDFLENGDITPLLEESPWEVKKFADKPKDVTCLMLGCTRKDLESHEYKESYLPSRWNYVDEQGFKKQMTVRVFLQRLATDAMRDHLHTDVWVNCLMSDYNPVPVDRSSTGWEFPRWIITDTRFPNELEAVKAQGGITIRVVRKNLDGSLYGVDYSKPEHPSECSLDNEQFKYTIINDGTLDDLVYNVEKMLILEKLL